MAKITHAFPNGCTATITLHRGKNKYSGSGQILYDSGPPDYGDKPQWPGFFDGLQEILGNGKKLDFSMSRASRNDLVENLYWTKYELHPLATGADRINLIMPAIVWSEGASIPLPVTCRSPKSHRKAVWKIAQFFRREFKFDFCQYGAEAMIVMLITQPIDACCFRKPKELKGEMLLDWVWFHPYYRRRDFLSRAWPLFRELHGIFHVEGPLSTSMMAFLRKRLARGDVFPPTLTEYLQDPDSDD